MTGENRYTHEFSISQEIVNQFAGITGDDNPLHLNEEFAAQTPFKKPIIHGFLGGSIFSMILGTKYPGPGSIYMHQEMNFLRPMYPGTVYIADVSLLETDSAKHTAVLKTTVTDKETGKTVIDGKAKVMNKEKF